MVAAGAALNATSYCQFLRLAALQPTLALRQHAATATWRAMVEAGVAPTTECYNAMLAVSLVGDPMCRERALEAVQEMRSAGLRVRADTFNTIMAAAVTNGDFVLVRALLCVRCTMSGSCTVYWCAVQHGGVLLGVHARCVWCRRG